MHKALKTSVALPVFLAALTSCSGPKHSSPSALSIQPKIAQVASGQMQSFQAYSGGTVVTSPISWLVNGVVGGNSGTGTISSFGLYTAPNTVPTPSSVTITATLQADSTQTASATAVVGPDISISPPLPVVQTYGTQQFIVTVTGVANTAVTWQVSCHEGGTACGAISQAGLYKAPNSVPTAVSGNGAMVADAVTITATSQVAPAFSGSVVASILSLNQQAQATPILLGTSGSNENNVCVVQNQGLCVTGTLGSLLTRGGVQYVLSNSHVLVRGSGGVVGDPVIQPGLNDTQPLCSTTGTTVVANLSEFTNPQTDTGTLVDAAIARVVSGAVDPNGVIEELGSTVVNGVPQAGAPAQGSGIVASVGELVAKSGRSTGATCSTIEAINVSVKVQSQTPCSTSTSTVTFPDEVTVGGEGFSAGGDSGALIVDGNTAQPVALLFAGDATTTIANPISDVLNALRDSNNNMPSFVGGAPHSVAACSLPQPSASERMRTRSAVPATAMGAAQEIRDRNAQWLLAAPSVTAVGIGESLDSPGEPAILLFVQRGEPDRSIPMEIEGIRTRKIEVNPLQTKGLLSLDQSNKVVSDTKTRPTSSVSVTALKEAVSVKQKHAGEWMVDSTIQGLGVGFSLDNPDDPALIFYVSKGTPRNMIPATIDNVRIRIKETQGFYAGISNARISSGCTNPVHVSPQL